MGSLFSFMLGPDSGYFCFYVAWADSRYFRRAGSRHFYFCAWEVIVFSLLTVYRYSRSFVQGNPLLFSCLPPELLIAILIPAQRANIASRCYSCDKISLFVTSTTRAYSLYFRSISGAASVFSGQAVIIFAPAVRLSLFSFLLELSLFSLLFLGRAIAISTPVPRSGSRYACRCAWGRLLLFSLLLPGQALAILLRRQGQAMLLSLLLLGQSIAILAPSPGAGSRYSRSCSRGMLSLFSPGAIAIFTPATGAGYRYFGSCSWGRRSLF
jgi:hypothetical protein